MVVGYFLAVLIVYHPITKSIATDVLVRPVNGQQKSSSALSTDNGRFPQCSDHSNRDPGKSVSYHVISPTKMTLTPASARIPTG